MTFSDETRKKFPAATKALEAGELYVPCPDCFGSRTIHAYRDRHDPSSGDYFNCNCCGATGEAPAEQAKDFIEAWERNHE